MSRKQADERWVGCYSSGDYSICKSMEVCELRSLVQRWEQWAVDYDSGVSRPFEVPGCRGGGGSEPSSEGFSGQRKV